MVPKARRKFATGGGSSTQNGRNISNNLGDTKSLITHPTTTTHRVIGEEARKKLNIPDNMIRLSIGLEDAEDLIEDIENALKQIVN